MARIGVFVCHCGRNIAGTVNVLEVAEKARKIKDVVFATNYVFMCSDPGQQLLKRSIEEHKLDGVVVACCTPTLHHSTFRNAASQAGLNQFRVEIANIREQVAWPHEHDKEIATKKALRVIEAAVKKVKYNLALEPVKVPVTRRALIIGGGIAGIQAAIDLAEGGYEVYLVERTPTVGGNMFRLSETFPTLDCPQCIITPKMNQVAHHPNIHLYTYSEVIEVSGFVGNFKVKIRKKSTYVDWDKCTGCGDCTQVCPVKVPSEFERGVVTRHAIYIPNEQAVPLVATVDENVCAELRYQRRVKEGKAKPRSKPVCSRCVEVCEVGTIDLTHPNEEIIEVDVGAIIVATGFDLLPLDFFEEYGGGKIKDVVDALQFERLLAPSGPTDGVPRRLSDGKVPKRVVWIQCAGSRDPEHGMAYCSRVCCMYTAKQALLYKHAVPDGEAYIFYIDIRSNGKGYEEFVQRVREEGIIYLRGKVAKIAEDGNGKLRVFGSDTLVGKPVEIEADMVVLSPAMIPAKGARELASLLRIGTDEYGWFKEAHLKLRPVETVTSGIFIAGAAHFPKDITDTVSQASGAASKVQALLSRQFLEREPLIAEADPEVCAGCGYCVNACSYSAVQIDPIQKVAKVNEALCEGCGACAAACPSGAMSLRNLTKPQVMQMIEVMTSEYA